MKKHISILFIVLLLTVCQGCGGKPIESFFNPYNSAAATDGEDVYYCERTGIYRIPGGVSGAEKIAGGETIIGIALHGGTIYYRDNCTLGKVDTDGGNQMTFDIGHNVLMVGCLNDTLYINTMDGYFTADITSDPHALALVKQTGRPAPNGVFYSMEHMPDRDPGCSLYRISPETGEKTEVLHDVWHHEYIITDRSIFYHDRDGVYKAGLDGQNSIMVCDHDDTGTSIIGFYNYDDQWVYMGLSPGGFMRMDQETGELEPVVFDVNPGGFDIVGDYVYGYDHGEIVRMKLPDGEVVFAPFE